MRDFSWKYFSMTGDVDAYLLYKQSLEEEQGEPEIEEDSAVKAAADLLH
ncbi:YqzL family protein [Paenibacillus filicis]|uniref:YqzL family protein n=1 Tax=Paenibacillus gyeongsangnamensis TaxID=3388067 RepID=A0ABT4Q2S8_9BACL|nr:YqzL family protein [Paenibacillus filicis]MCZ8511181.1 YqzL family protein [Paenibacillus filicis]